MINQAPKRSYRPASGLYVVYSNIFLYRRTLRSCAFFVSISIEMIFVTVAPEAVIAVVELRRVAQIKVNCRLNALRYLS